MARDAGRPPHSFFGRRLSRGSVSAGGRAARSQTAAARRRGKTMRALLRASPRRMIAAARSTSIKSGMGKALTAVIGVFTVRSQNIFNSGFD